MDIIKPIEVTDVDLAFGGNMEQLLPPYEDIPSEFKDESNEYFRFVSAWFYYGSANLEVSIKEDVDSCLAIRHIMAILRSYEPSHEHKMAGAAYLASVFFKMVKISER